ncbi:MAG: hypothetical protein R2874_11000 [Desulfobacterales bacterium]
MDYGLGQMPEVSRPADDSPEAARIAGMILESKDSEARKSLCSGV